MLTVPPAPFRLVELAPSSFSRMALTAGEFGSNETVGLACVGSTSTPAWASALSSSAGITNTFAALFTPAMMRVADEVATLLDALSTTPSASLTVGFRFRPITCTEPFTLAWSSIDGLVSRRTLRCALISEPFVATPSIRMVLIWRALAPLLTSGICATPTIVNETLSLASR